ncbi:MAG: hypothetical protein U7127_30880 (plasmid) [Phormidium sp.]
MQFHFKFLGIWFSNCCGNCFAPALQFNQYGLTFRSKNWLETQFYRCSDGSFDWNSDHIAFYLGKCTPGDEQKGYPDIYEYRGILGYHQYI